MLLCCTIFNSKSIAHGADYHHKRATISFKANSLKSNALPDNPYVTYNILEGNQVITQQVHRTVHTVHIAYLQSYSFSACIKCLNFFSGNNNDGHSLSNKILLFPFHAFW